MSSQKPTIQFDSCATCIHQKPCSELASIIGKNIQEMIDDEHFICENFAPKISDTILLPCKIGGTIYEVTKMGGVLDRVVTGYHYNSVGKQKGAWFLIDTPCCGMRSRIKIDRIGEDVFLDRDVAENLAFEIRRELKREAENAAKTRSSLYVHRSDN